MNNLDETNTLDILVDKNMLEWYTKFYSIHRSDLDLLDSLVYEKPSEINWYNENWYRRMYGVDRPDWVCKCKKEKDSIEESSKSKKPRKPKKQKEKIEGKSFCSVRWKYVFKSHRYEEVPTYSQVFFVKPAPKISLTEQSLFDSFKNKYLYDAIDDILYALKSNIKKRDNLLELLYLPVIALQNNAFLDFFEIWIGKISVKKMQRERKNKFLTNNNQNLEQITYLEMKFNYRRKRLSKKQESLW